MWLRPAEMGPTPADAIPRTSQDLAHQVRHPLVCANRSTLSISEVIACVVSRAYVANAQIIRPSANRVIHSLLNVPRCAVKCAIPGAPICAFKGLSNTCEVLPCGLFVEGKLLILQWLPPRDSYH